MMPASRGLALGWLVAGPLALAARHRRAIHDLLKPCLERGMTFDPPIVQRYETLKAEFAK